MVRPSVTNDIRKEHPGDSNLQFVTAKVLQSHLEKNGVFREQFQVKRTLTGGKQYISVFLVPTRTG